MSETPKKKSKLCERRTISFDADLYGLALQRMKEEGETMFSRYVQRLVQKDTAELRKKALLEIESVGEAPTPSKDATAPVARFSSVSLKQKRTK